MGPIGLAKIKKTASQNGRLWLAMADQKNHSQLADQYGWIGPAQIGHCMRGPGSGPDRSRFLLKSDDPVWNLAPVFKDAGSIKINFPLDSV